LLRLGRNEVWGARIRIKRRSNFHDLLARAAGLLDIASGRGRIVDAGLPDLEIDVGRSLDVFGRTNAADESSRGFRS